MLEKCGYCPRNLFVMCKVGKKQGLKFLRCIIRYNLYVLYTCIFPFNIKSMGVNIIVTQLFNMTSSKWRQIPSFNLSTLI